MWIVVACAASLIALAGTACDDECGDLTRVCDREGESCHCARPCATSDDCGEHEYCLHPSPGLCVPIADFVSVCDGRSCRGACSGERGCARFCKSDGDCAASEHCGNLVRLTALGTRKSVRICRPMGAGGCAAFVEDPRQETHGGYSLPMGHLLGGESAPYWLWDSCACKECPACNVPNSGTTTTCAPYPYEPVSPECDSCVTQCSLSSEVGRVGCCRGVGADEPSCASCASAHPKNRACSVQAEECLSCLERVKAGACAAAWTHCSADR